MSYTNLDIFYQFTSSSMFDGNNKKPRWSLEYEDTIYKVYDWNRNLAAYFFPNYELAETDESEDEIIEKLNQTHQNVRGGNILFPMIKLNLLDKEKGIDLDYTIIALEQNLGRTKLWKEWLLRNSSKFEITRNSVFTSREDREMLSIALKIDSTVTLGEKQTLAVISPILNELHEASLL
jgi:hypothetical protein